LVYDLTIVIALPKWAESSSFAPDDLLGVSFAFVIFGRKQESNLLSGRAAAQHKVELSSPSPT
jgi:hypothetical protein